MRLPITGAHSRSATCAAFTAAAAATAPATTSSCSTAPRPPASVAVFSVAVSIHQALGAGWSEASLPIAHSLPRRSPTLCDTLIVHRCHHPRAHLFPRRVRWARARTARVCRRTGQERAKIAAPQLLVRRLRAVPRPRRLPKPERGGSAG